MFPLFGTLFGGGAIAILGPAFLQAIEEGGLHMTNNGRPEFWANPWGALFLVAFSLPFIAVGLFFWMYWLNNQIIVHDQGIRSINAFGHEDFIAAWPMLRPPRQFMTAGGIAVMRVVVDENELNIATNHPHCGQIVQTIRERTKPRALRIAEAKGNTLQGALPKPDLPDRTYRYRFPMATVFAVSPFLFMVAVGVSWGFLRTGGSIPGVFLATTLGIPLVFILGTAISAANARVVVTADRIHIVNGWGKTTLDAAWEDVVGVFYESDSSTEGDGVNPLGYYQTFRIDTKSQSARVRTSLRGFGSFLNELQARLPDEVLYYDD